MVRRAGRVSGPYGRVYRNAPEIRGPPWAAARTAFKEGFPEIRYRVSKPSPSALQAFPTAPFGVLRFQRQEALFDFQAAAEAGEGAVRAHHPVAGDQQDDGV